MSQLIEAALPLIEASGGRTFFSFSPVIIEPKEAATSLKNVYLIHS